LAGSSTSAGPSRTFPVFDKSGRRDGTFERVDFAYDHECDLYACGAAGNSIRAPPVFVVTFR